MDQGAGPAILDLLEPGFRVNSPVVRAAAKQHWYATTSLGPAILRYDDCVALINHRDMGQASTHHLMAQGITEGPVAETWSRMVLNTEGPDHARLRRLVTPAFSPAVVERLRQRMREIVNARLGRFAPVGRCEFMSEFADRYVPRVLFELLGIPAEDHDQFLAWGKAIALLISYDVPRHYDRVAAAIAGLGEMTDRLCAQRRRAPGPDLLSGLVAASDGQNRLTQAEIRATVALLVFGGQDSTRLQLGLGIQTFSQHPKQWKLLAERPELAPAAVEEVMRVNPVDPIGPWRLATVDIDYRDLHIPAGTRIWPLPGIAQLEFGTSGEDAPFDIATEGRPHLSFGHGTHFCLGARLARVEMAEAFPILAQCHVA